MNVYILKYHLVAKCNSCKHCTFSTLGIMNWNPKRSRKTAAWQDWVMLLCYARIDCVQVIYGKFQVRSFQVN